ncbi:S-layer family protein [Myxococcota bacterium]|nr:S-layer family protein [Myxococcota bacterium]
MPPTRAPETTRNELQHLALLAATVLLFIAPPNPSVADVVFDGTIGSVATGTSAKTADRLYVIPEPYGEKRGSNLFHSFNEFEVGSEETARITGSSLERVILRLTRNGLAPAALENLEVHTMNLEGTLESEIPGADIVLLSPEGISVGGNARFDVQGSLSMSTAQALTFSDGSFRSSGEGDPWTSTDPAVPCCGQAPTGFDFDVATDPELGKLNLDLPTRGQVLRIPRGKALRAVARSFSASGGQILTDGGTLYVAAVGAAAIEVPTDLDAETTWLAQVGADGIVELESIVIAAQPESLPNPSGGRVLLRGGKLVMNSGAIIRANGSPTQPGIDLAASRSITLDGRLERYQNSAAVLTGEAGVRLIAPEVILGEAQPGQIRVKNAGAEIRADSVRMAGGSRITVYSTSGDGTQPLVLEVGNLTMEGENTTLEARDGAPGLPQTLVIRADDAVELRNGASITSTPSRSSDAGGISIEAAALQLDGDGTAIQTVGRAADAPESINIVTNGEVALDDGAVISSLPSENQDAGNIRIEAGALSLEDGAQIQTPTQNARATGDIDVVVDGPIRISGVKVLDNGKAAAGLRTQAGPNSLPGSRAGDVTLEADSLEITDGGLITSSSEVSGSAGEIRIRTHGRVLIGGSDEGIPAEIASRGFGEADAGSIELQVGSLEIRDDGGIFASSFGTQPGGGIRIDAAEQVVIVDGNVNAQAYRSESGGDIWITAAQLIELVNSKIETRVRFEEGSGGNIFIGSEAGPQLAVINDSRIKADANQGPGGNITIRAGNLLQSAEPGQIDASSDAGLDGNVEIAAPEVQAEGQLAPLPVAYLDVTAILREHCASRRGAGSSSFVIEGQPGIAPEPGDYLPAFPSLPADEAAAGANSVPAPGIASVSSQLTSFDCGAASTLSAAR